MKVLHSYITEPGDNPAKSIGDIQNCFTVKPSIQDIKRIQEKYEALMELKQPRKAWAELNQMDREGAMELLVLNEALLLYCLAVANEPKVN